MPYEGYLRERDVITEDERRMIDEHIAKHGVTKCAMGQEAKKSTVYMERARRAAGSAFSRAKISKNNRAGLYDRWLSENG